MLRIICNQLSIRIGRSPFLTRCFTTETQKNFENLDREKKIKIIELELSFLHQEGGKAPDPEKLKPSHWDEILELSSRSARNRFYHYLWHCEVGAARDKEKKEMKKAETLLRLKKTQEENAENDHIVYGLHRNTMFLRIYDKTVNNFNNWKLMRSMMFDQKIILDCSYDEFMNRKEATNAGKQLMLCFAENRIHDQPFDLHLCNFNPNSITSKTLSRYIPTLYDDDFPMNLHTESITEKFDRDRLVYLTPHCRDDLKTFSHDDIYVIGAMVDKCNNEPLSLAKAKKQNIRMARLPLDLYLDWGRAGKSLTLNQVLNIMLEMKTHGDWEKALRFVPRRKLAHPSEKSPQKLNYESPSSNYQRQNSYDRQTSYEPRKQNNYYQDRQRFPSESTQSYSDQLRHNDDQYNNRQRSSFDRKQLGKERQHFERFKFNLDTWGSKVKRDPNPKNQDE